MNHFFSVSSATRHERYSVKYLNTLAFLLKAKGQIQLVRVELNQFNIALRFIYHILLACHFSVVNHSN